jgi:hypothetical protein
LTGEGVVAARRGASYNAPRNKADQRYGGCPKSKALEKEEQTGKNQTMLNGGPPTKQPNTETKSPNAATSQGIPSIH